MCACATEHSVVCRGWIGPEPMRQVKPWLRGAAARRKKIFFSSSASVIAALPPPAMLRKHGDITVPVPPPPPACHPRAVEAHASAPQWQAQGSVRRGGWFNKCQELCEAVLQKRWEDVEEIAAMHYAKKARPGYH